MADAAPAAPLRRLFFALWPDAGAATALEAAARLAHAACGGRCLQRDSLHLTLAFLGDLPAERAAAAEAAAADLAGEAFPLRLDRLGYWRHNRILWAGCDLPPPLAALAAELAARLGAAGFTLEARPFAAHVSLLRNARCQTPPALDAPIDWPVGGFVLVESQLSRSGARYQVRRRWPLRSA